MNCNIDSSIYSPRLYFALIGILTILLLFSEVAYGQTKRIASIKSLTHSLSQIEKQNGPHARYVTIKLQIYLEDIYISQGTEIILDTKSLSSAVESLLKQKIASKQMASIILRRYKDGEFHD